MVPTPRLNVLGNTTSVRKMVVGGTLILRALPLAARRSARSHPWWPSRLLTRNIIPEARILTHRTRLPLVVCRRLHHHHRRRAILVILITSSSTAVVAEEEVRLEALILRLALLRILTINGITDFLLRILRTAVPMQPHPFRQEAFTRKSPFLLHQVTALLKRMVPTLTMRTTSTCLRTTTLIGMVI